MLTIFRRKNIVFTDLDKDLSKNPINNDIIRITDEESIKESLKNLIMTDKLERLFQPNIGCDIRKLLFENITPDTVIIAKDVITNTINTYEPRVNLISVDVVSTIDSNEINIIIVFNIQNKENPISLNIILDRIR